jgi:radical SAM protein with 4Fe4S-binding SPASM domain
MYYRLAPDIGLRSWKDNPCGYFRRGGRDTYTIGEAGFALLCECDGTQDLELTPMLTLLCLQGLIEPCQSGETIADWQRLRVCDNISFSAINWAITQRCNYNCRHCFMASESGYSHEEFSWEECLALIDEIEACGIWRVSLTGGEPLVHPRFADIVRELSRRDIEIFEIATNGVLLSRETLDLLASLGQRPLMKISFDGLGHHDWLRNCTGAEAVALDAIARCVAHDFPVRVQMNVHRSNLDCLFASVDAMEALGAEQTRVIRTSKGPRWEQDYVDETLDFTEYYDAMSALIQHYIQKPRRMKLTLWQFVELDPQTKRYHNRPVKFCRRVGEERLPLCEMNRMMVSVTGAGEIVPCNQMEGLMKSRGLSFGNVHQSGLQTLLRTGTYCDTTLMSIGDVRRHSPEKCGSCPYWALCAGGCPALAMGLSGSMLGSDPVKCAFFTGGYLEKVRDIFQGEDGWLCVDDLDEAS